MRQRLLAAKDKNENLFIVLSSQVAFDDCRVIDVQKDTVLVRFEIADTDKTVTHEALVSIASIISIGVDVSTFSYSLA